MVDIMDSQTRSKVMSRIRSRDTKPELLLRRSLHARGFRFRLCQRDLPGSPDIVLRKWNAVIFVHGCFWHRHSYCRYAATPKSRSEFWLSKFDANVARDRATQLTLRNEGWRVAVVWECALKVDAAGAAATLIDWLTAEPALDRIEIEGLGDSRR
ncbi:DNA mismatch endonuclease Vsr [Tabrizicola piscis]|uniref:Very short patch repair endonuclease n=1 Tax=Tabrizicola piscis TaxID=2494374 RepID=A0A3S8U5P7_9RHOB|nr:DNA mismatch endonuclease Vsr [Tabrizicola piscis]AZL58946.1 DNA mismatch endonuclease Vsr [Tabrizicola piscis]